MKLARPLAAALLCASTFFGTGCKSGEPWAFAVTRSVNESGVGGELVESSVEYEHSGEVALAVILAPFVIDLVLLPLTLTHDAVACK